MTEQEKQELLIALCGYLPYGVKCQVTYIDKYEEIQTRDVEQNCSNVCMDQIVHLNEYSWLDCKLYLRPMSSMTEDERKQYMDENALDNCDEMNNIQKHYKELRNCQNNQFDEYYHQYIQLPRVHAEDYLNSIHVDYRGLIPMGLALEAPEDMYNL